MAVVLQILKFNKENKFKPPLRHFKCLQNKILIHSNCFTRYVAEACVSCKVLSFQFLISVVMLPQNLKKNLPTLIQCYSVASNLKCKIFSNFVTFSEYPNFNDLDLFVKVILECFPHVMDHLQS